MGLILCHAKVPFEKEQGWPLNRSRQKEKMTFGTCLSLAESFHRDKSQQKNGLFEKQLSSLSQKIFCY